MTGNPLISTQSDRHTERRWCEGPKRRQTAIHQGERPQQIPGPWSWTSASRTVRKSISMVEATQSETLGFISARKLRQALFPHYTPVMLLFMCLRPRSVLWEIA